MNDYRYFSRSWALLTRDKGWIKPILVMAAASLVPIAGELGNKGYALEWARLTAWGVDSSPKQKNVQVGKCIASGWRGFVVELGWGLLLGIALSLITMLFGLFPGTFGELLSSFVRMVLSVVSAFFSVVFCLCQIRAAIYESIGAGYQANRIIDMIKRDMRGFTRVFVVSLVSSLILGVAIGIVVVMVIVMCVPFIIGLSKGNMTDYELLRALTPMVIPGITVCMILGYVFSIFTNTVRLIVCTSTALWMRQFNVPAWGRSTDPLPYTPNSGMYDAAGAYPQAPMGQQPQQPYGQPPQQQPQQPQPQQWQQQPYNQPQPVPQPQPEAQQPQQPQPQPEQEPPAQPQQPPTAPLPQQPPTTPLPRHDQQDVAEPVIEEQPAAPEPEPDVTQDIAEDVTEDLYDDLMDAIRENDYVEGDDEE